MRITWSLSGKGEQETGTVFRSKERMSRVVMFDGLGMRHENEAVKSNIARNTRIRTNENQEKRLHVDLKYQIELHSRRTDA